jgi:hypothetical protein
MLMARARKLVIVGRGRRVTFGNTLSFFEDDMQHRLMAPVESYDRDAPRRCWRSLTSGLRRM